jgi:hypothetical protein
MLKQATLEERFLEEVRAHTGKGAADLQLPAIRAALEPMWLALPKNQHGGLDNAQVRYALHRLFVQRHGWYIDGLSGMTNESSSPSTILRERVPNMLMELFDEAFGNTGLKLEELAIFAGTLERLIHDETVERLKGVYSVLSTEVDSQMSQDTATQALQLFFTSLVLKKDYAANTNHNRRRDITFMEVNYPSWGQAKTWLEKVLLETVPGQSDYSFDQMEAAAEQVSMQLSGFLDGECRHMKSSLLEAEERNSGRVPLSKFYKKGLEKGLHFVEKPAYMRQLGALDESQPGEARVIVANWMDSPSNCLIDTGFYSVCCVNECNNVMVQLERAVGSAGASPKTIVAEISKISTSTVVAPRELPERMISRLQTVADRNDGVVPLYGRLFTQWLHFVFPRECAFPHPAGSVNPLTPEDYLKTTMEKATMTRSDLDEFIGKVGSADEEQPVEDDHLLTRWSDEEEILFLPTGTHTSAPAKLLRIALMLAVLTAILVAAGDTLKRFGGFEVLGKMEKPHLV